MTIRLEVPNHLGTAYTNPDGTRQWVELRQGMPSKMIERFQELAEVYGRQNAFLAVLFTDWDLCSDDGPLPKPEGNPRALDAILESDTDLSMWILGLMRESVIDLKARSLH